MDTIGLISLNLLSPVVLAFVLGGFATLLRSDLKFPDELYTALSIYLLLALGLKGGAELSQASMSVIWAPVVATLALGVATPLLSYVAVRYLGRLNVVNASAIAAHYGSVSVVTFMAALSFLEALEVQFEPYLTTLLVILEVPAIIVALAIAGGANELKRRSWREVIHDTIVGKSVFLLMGGLFIGFLTGKEGLSHVEGFFEVPFQGAVMLFLLEMGMVAFRRMRDFRKVGVFLLLFALIAPVVNGALGIWFGYLSGLSLGGTMVLGIMAASASYIAAPAAVRAALPEANPSYYLTMALGITFPFNLTFGIPLFYYLARMIHA